MLRERAEQFPVSLMGYCITSNHVHVLIRVNEGEENTLSRFMHSLEGNFSKYYNRRKARSGAFWGDRYHAVMIDSGEYLLRCLAYIDMNMVRAGVIEHPREWDWCGYNELAGMKKRNRLIDQKALLSTGAALADFQQNYLLHIEKLINSRKLAREAYWTESLAVGCPEYVDRMKRRIKNRLTLETETIEGETNMRRLREPQELYGDF